MKKTILLSLIFISMAFVGFSQDCNTQAANKPSTLVRFPNAISSPSGKMSSSDLAKLKPYLDKAENWIKNRLTNIKIT